MKQMSKITLTLFIFAGFLCLFFYSLPVKAEAPAVSLKDNLNNPSPFTPVDCSCAIKPSYPGRQVMQIIDNQYYLWHETMDFANNTICIYQVEPEEKALSAEEAEALLANSELWQQQAADRIPNHKITAPEALNNNLPASFKVYTNHISTPPVHNETPEEWYWREQEMTDNRSPVDKEMALTYPYNNIGFLNVDFPGSYIRGTAFLVGPNLALTNAHNIYSPPAGGWYEEVLFSAAQHETNYPTTIKPHTTRKPVHLQTNEKFFYYENNKDRDMAVKYDYAALFFDEPFSEITTFMPLEFNAVPSEIIIYGYPGYVRDIQTNGLWESKGTLINYNDYCLYYDAYTSGGNSGSPVIAYRPETGSYRVIGVHAFASPGYFSGGPHFNYKNQTVIEGWLKKAPDYINSSLLSLQLPATLNMMPGEQITLEPHPATAHTSYSELTWNNANPEVATVSEEGIVKGLSEGTTLITVRAKNDNQEASCLVIVSSNIKEENIEDTGTETAAIDSSLGDLNNDQDINILDVVLVLQHILEITTMEQDTLAKADVNQDGSVDVLDATLIMQRALEIIEHF